MTSSQKWLPRIALVWVIFMSLYSFRIARLDAGPSLDGWVATALVAVLFVIGISNVITIRYVVLPRSDLVPEERKHLVPLVSYVFVAVPAVYGLVLAVLTSRGFIGLPFGAMALVGLLLVGRYLRGTRQQAT